MNNGVWNSYHIQNALVIISEGRPKVVCAWFKSEARWNWNWKLEIWEEKETEAHISVCSRVPPHIARLWTPGARADDQGQGVEGSTGGSGWGQGGRGSNTGAASSGGSGWGQGVGESNTGAASSGGSGWGYNAGDTGAADSGGNTAPSPESMWL